MSDRSSSSFGENPSRANNGRISWTPAVWLRPLVGDDLPRQLPVCWKAEKQREAAVRVTVSNGIWGGHEWVWALPAPEPERVWVLGMKGVAFCPRPTPWVEPQFTESYQRFSFVFFGWIIIVIAPFHKAANQWPRVNGVKHSGFRVALPQRTLQRRSSGTGVQGKHLLEGDTWEKENLCHLRADLWSNSSL